MSHALARMVNTAVERWYQSTYEPRMADRGFDGGEWSGSAWAYIEHEYISKIINQVAEYSGVHPDTIHTAWVVYQHATDQMVYDGKLPESVLY